MIRYWMLIRVQLMTRRTILLLLLMMALPGVLVAPAPALAKNGSDDSDDDDDDKDEDDDKDKEDDEDDEGLDQEEASEAVREGRILPLSRALEILGARHGGRVIDINLTRSRGQYVYRFTLRETAGRVRKVSMNAKTGQISRASGSGS